MTSSATTTQAQAAGTGEETGNWFPENLAQINAALALLAAQPAATAPVAVFDFDNTCIFRDVGQAVFRFQALHLRYRLAPEQLAAILPRSGGELAGRPLVTVTALLLEAYRQLWPLIAAGRADAARQSPPSRLFAALLFWFTEQARKDERFGPRYVLPFMGKLLAGFTTGELRQLAMEVVRAVRAEPLLDETLTEEAPEPLGRIEASYPLGLHAYPEMIALMHRLARQGVERYVISASTEWLVAGAVELLGFPVGEDRIFGIRVRLAEDDRLTIDDPDGYPTTFREGKAEVITRLIEATPVLVAGDADTDFEMLTLPGVTIRLLLNRCQRGLISSLYNDPRILLQGLNLTTGRFRPARDSLAA